MRARPVSAPVSAPRPPDWGFARLCRRCGGIRSGMKKRHVLGLILGFQTIAAAADTPQEAWKKAIADQNAHYSQARHAMLKIQDAVYLGDGEAAALQGRQEQPASWRWIKGPDTHGSLQVSLKDKKLTVQWNGKPVDPTSLEKGISLGKDLDVAGQPTQVGAGVHGWRLF